MKEKLPSRPRFSHEGSVVRIYLKNFMIYRNETIYPGPNFNVTVGPNGSGKSSIVTALCIALGGDLKTLNRQMDLKSLINSDAENQAAIIEVELFSVKGSSSNIVIKCILKPNESVPSWQINKKVVSKEKLLALSAKLQIQPGNLCQFLPQDVVREFPQMKPAEIFENTLKAVGNHEMLEKLHKGTRIQESMETISDDLKLKEKTVNSLEQREKRHEDLAKKLQEQLTLEQNKSTAEKALAWKRFATLRTSMKKEKELKLKKTGEKQKLEQKLAKHVEFRDKYLTKVNAIKQKIHEAEHKFKKTGDQIEKRFDETSLEESIEQLVNREEDLDFAEKDRIKQKKSLETDIINLQKYVFDNGWTAVNEKELSDLREGIRIKEEKVNVWGMKIEEEERLAKMCSRDLERYRNQHQNLMNVRNHKMKVLEQINKDAYRGVLWLRQNTHLFKKHVHEPIMMTIKVKDQAMLRFLESRVSRDDLEGFVCEDIEDMNKLLKELRENQKLRKINVFHSDAVPKDSFIHPYSTEQLEEKYGFANFCGYLSDAFEAPEAIYAFLCQQKGLHKVPVFKTENNQTDKLKHDFSSYYVGDYNVHVSRSKYSKEVSTGMSDLSTFKVIRLGVGPDQSSIDELLSEINAREQKLVNHEAMIKNLKIEKKHLTGSLNKIEDSYKELEKRKKELKFKESEIKMKKEQLKKNLAEPKTNIEDEKKKLRSQKAKLVKELCKQVESNLPLISECGQLDLLRCAHQLQLQNVEGENQDSMHEVNELEKEFTVVKAELEKITEIYQANTNQIMKAHNLAAEGTGGVQDNEKKFLPPIEWQRRFKDLENRLKTRDDDVIGVDMLQAYVENCEEEIKRNGVNPDIKRKIEEEKNRLKKAREELRSLQERRAEKLQKLHRLRQGWINDVKKLVENVNIKFTEMMSMLDYSGFVELQEGVNDALDMRNYGIKIMVKFRSGDDFVELTKGTQSGGEKSVTTAVYMMALQGLTQVPFRCVDEINQGMDETNERKVWDMLLEVCRKHKAQYFYMAPKFPYDLPFNEQVTILTCNSGQVQPSKDFSTKKFVQISRNL